MKKLKIILHSNTFYFLLLLFLLFHLFYNFNFTNRKSRFNLNDKNFICTIEKYYLEGDMVKIDLDCSETLKGYYYFASEEEKNDFSNNYKIGDIVRVQGELKEIEESRNFNIFNYKKYSYIRNIFYQLNIEKIDFIKKDDSYIYKLENFILDRITNLKSFPYVNALILGNKDYIDKTLLNTYKDIGIMHLFSISGMHIGLLLLIIGTVFKRKTLLKDILSLLTVHIYYFLIGSISLLRALLFFLLSFFNKKLSLGLKKYQIIFLTIFIILIKNHYYIFDTSFLYSIIISSSLLLYANKINCIKNYYLKILSISFLSFLFSLPITIYNFFEINLLSFFYNSLIVPVVSIIIFPFCLAVIFMPFLDEVLSLFINILENISLFFGDISSSLVMMKPSLIVIFLYYVIIVLALKNKKVFIFLIILIFIHHNYNAIVRSDYIITFDVQQGDSHLIHSQTSDILIDTGGIVGYQSEKWKEKDEYSLAENIIIPVLKSYGIDNIDLLIISHGDADHAKEAANLINNFKVKKIYLNNNSLNEIESSLLLLAKEKNIAINKIDKRFEAIGPISLYSISYNSDNENDSSIINYVLLNNYKILFTADISSKTEAKLLKDYNIRNIDILKVGHHGSNTSSSTSFIETLSPKYSIISVGKNNRYNHPKESVLKTLEKSLIYRTDESGSILLNLKKRVTIYTCLP